jgi:hypothetical protein
MFIVAVIFVNEAYRKSLTNLIHKSVSSTLIGSLLWRDVLNTRILRDVLDNHL